MTTAKELFPDRTGKIIPNPLAPPFDVFLACAPKDFNKLYYVVQSIKRNVDGYQDIYVCSPIDVPGNIRERVGGSIIYCKDEDGLPRVARSDWKFRPNWSFQQHLKMFQKLTREWYLTIDCDTIVNIPMSFFERDKPVWWRGRDQNHEQYFRFQQEMIGIGRVAPYSFIADMNLFYRPFIDEMLNGIKHTIKSFIRKSQQIISPDCWVGEPELYGNYCYKNHSGFYLDRQLRQAPFEGRLQSDVNELKWKEDEIESRIREMSKTDYHTFSMHSWFEGDK